MRRAISDIARQSMQQDKHTRPSVYIAGPMVFYPDANERFQEMKRILGDCGRKAARQSTTNWAGGRRAGPPTRTGNLSGG